jgi:hypothetical protein
MLQSLTAARELFALSHGTASPVTGHRTDDVINHVYGIAKPSASVAGTVS